jgi:OmpA-OmpF porin, OOP family
MRRNRMFVLLALSLVALLLVSGCATKKFVREEITTTETKLNQKMDQEHGKIAGQISELSSLNKQLSSRIEQVSDRVTAIDGKTEQAKALGTEAKNLAQSANTAVVDLRTKFDARNNYVVTDTKSVLFGFNKHELTPEATAILDEMARLIAGNKNAVITLEGYTDSIGSDNYNLALSEKRANAVIRYLVGEKSVDLNRIYYIGMGKANPVADNKTEAGRQENRRVTIKALEVQ